MIYKNLRDWNDKENSFQTLKLSTVITIINPFNF